MSRQTGECFAEVTFETQKGRYRSHWSQHRARKKPEGELQPARHEISNADDGAVLESKLSRVSEFVEEVFGIGKNYSRVTHVVVDDVMKNKGVHIGPKGGVFRTIYMTNETWNASYLKFKKQPFELVYRNESRRIDSITLEPIHWAEVYAINWTYIESVI